MIETGRGKSVLVVDDDPGVTASLALLLKQAGYRAGTAGSPQEALSLLEEQTFDVVLQDMNFSRRTDGAEGLDLLQAIKGSLPHLPVVLITAWGSLELAVRGVKAGASDFITKPWSNQQILQAVGTALGLAEVRRRDAEDGPLTRADLDATYEFSGLVGRDPRFLAVLQVIGRVAATDAPVLITGESGTGKELCAEGLWRNSPRSGRHLVKVNLGGIPGGLFESEMFGHVRGAFTDARQDRVGRFEAAEGGTLFLDEIGDLDLACQVKLLRVLQDRTFERVGSSRPQTADVRVVSATNRDLTGLIAAGQFREDLLYRLNLITVTIPPLRERRRDIPLLAGHLLQGIAADYQRQTLRLEPAAMDWLSSQPWPGNVRQLKHLIERAVLLTTRDTLRVADLVTVAESPTREQETATTREPVGGTLAEVERRTILAAIREHSGNLTRVAEALGLSRGALYRRLEKYGIDT